MGRGRTKADTPMGSFTTLDYSIVAIYVVASLLIGLRYAGKQKSVEDYFVADRSARWWAVAISAIATGLSAISYLGVPAWVFRYDLQLNVAVFLLPLFMLLVVRLFVPLLARLRLMTIYEYLETRFNLGVRTLTSSLFLILRGGWLATAIYTQSLLLTELTGIPMIACVGIVGVLTAVYTVLGGMEAVLWTDVMQFFVLVGGLVAILVVVLVSFGGDVGQIWSIASAGGHTRIVTTDFSFFKIVIWAVVLNYLVDILATYGSDQVMVQRFMTSRSMKDMRRSVMFTGLLTVPVVVLLGAVGLALVAYYQTHPQVAATLSNPDRVVPHFVGTVLPPGIAGLVIAGVFAATMSTLSAGFNSLATATCVDFIFRFRRSGQSPAEADASASATARPADTSVAGAPVLDYATPPRPPGPQGRSDVLIARGVTIAWALASTVAALFVGRLGSIVEIFGKISGSFAGPILGVFLLGILTRRPGGAAAVIGMAAGVAATWIASSVIGVYWLWYSPAGCSTTFLVGLLVGQVLRSPEDPRRFEAVATGAVQG